MTGRTSRRSMWKPSVRPGWLPNKAWRDERVCTENFPLPPMWIDDVRFERASFASIGEARHARSIIQRVAAMLLLHERLDELYARSCTDAWTGEELGLS